MWSGARRICRAWKGEEFKEFAKHAAEDANRDGAVERGPMHIYIIYRQMNELSMFYFVIYCFKKGFAITYISTYKNKKNQSNFALENF